MERKAKVLVYLPRKLYIELHERQLTNHVSYLVSRLLEEFLKAGVRISWEEMPTKAEQREYLDRKLEEVFSRVGALVEPEPSKSSVQEKPKEVVKEKPSTSSKEEDDWDDDFLKRLESFW
uniref:Uncharacterized protein n=1 Tax=Thermocrinis ruber TaxID=75906 RepID=A0A7C5X401_9AQUI